MGLSSNQARFLSLTSRQIDMEQRIQQICQRRLRLSSELENVATAYNTAISNRKMFTPSLAGLNTLSIDTLKKIGYRVIDSDTKTLANTPLRAINQLSETAAVAQGYTTIHNAQELKTALNAATAGQKFILQGDIDLSELGPQSTAIVTNDFQGTFDGNGYAIRNLNIGTSSGNNLGLFSTLTNATVQNVAIENVNISAANSAAVGALAGSVSNSTIKNSYSVDGNISALKQAGGLIGYSNGTTISDSYSGINVTAGYGLGGLAGAVFNGSVSTCYATGNIVNNNISNYNPGCDTGGLVGTNIASSVTNAYATGNVTGVIGNTGGLVGYNRQSTVTNSYAGGHASGGGAGGVVGSNGSPAGSDNATNFYTDTALGDGGSATTNQATATAGWGATGAWDLSGSLPKLISTGDISATRLEEGLRNGRYSLAKVADEYTQDPINIGGTNYQEVDWRSTPEIYDELFGGDDVDAENKYDKIISEINAQDKKLQLEQTSIETEYKAVTSEREAVKKILDTNAQNSFKYFS